MPVGRVIVEQRESEALSALWRSFVTNLAIGIFIILLTIGTIAYAINLYQTRLEDMAVTDKLTGIGNRQLLDIALDDYVPDVNRGKLATRAIDEFLAQPRGFEKIALVNQHFILRKLT